MSMWRVTYLNDTTLCQRMGGQSVSSEVVDRPRVKLVELLLNDGNVVVAIPIGPNQNFFYRHRTRMSGGNIQICHILGRTINGAIDGPITFHIDEGVTEQVDGFITNHPWFYPVNFRPCEL